MRVVIAPDSFKGTLAAPRVAEAMAEGLLRTGADVAVDRCPMADGGEGTLDIVVTACGGVRRRVPCHGPLGEPREAAVGLIEQASTGVVELAEAAGLGLVPPQRRDPLRATTFGVGELLAAALEAEVDRIIVALGGSATVDGGCGLAQALGLAAYDAAGRGLSAPLEPRRFRKIARIDAGAMVERFMNVEVVLAVDVLNPLLGPRGAATVFGPQKGADCDAVARLEEALGHWANLVERASGRPVHEEPGSGAAGGAGLPLLAFAGAAVVPGADLVIDAVRLRDRIAEADLVITGEGRLDRQSAMGKVVGAVARLARAADVPCVAVVGSVGEGYEEVGRQLDRLWVLGDDDGAAPPTAQGAFAQLSAMAAGILR